MHLVYLDNKDKTRLKKYQQYPGSSDWNQRMETYFKNIILMPFLHFPSILFVLGKYGLLYKTNQLLAFSHVYDSDYTVRGGEKFHLVLRFTFMLEKVSSNS